LRFHLKDFVIPDFPLGALLALGLFGVGLVFAFPDDPYVWLWEIVIAFAIILWVIGAGLFASLPTNYVKQAPKATAESARTQNDGQKSGLSSSFSALVDAINSHSRANIAEESKEDYERSLRERITIVLLAITMFAIISQVIEMRKVYEPIRDQAKAALDQAAAAKDATIAARDATVTSSRAWIGPTGATINKEPTRDSGIKIDVTYINSGKQPGTGLSVTGSPVIMDASNIDGILNLFAKNINDCIFAASIGGGEVVYPTTGFSTYQEHLTITKDQIDDGLIAGTKAIFIPGCFTYETFGESHHSAFCFLYRKGLTTVPNLNFCTGGSYAN
jgi:hypothetical protein